VVVVGMTRVVAELCDTSGSWHNTQNRERV